MDKRKPFRVFYKFEPYFINGNKHQWEACFLVDRNEWIYDLLHILPEFKGHMRYKEIDKSLVSLRDVFLQNVVDKVKVFAKKDYGQGLDTSNPIYIKGFERKDFGGFTIWL